jgi:ribosomal-protein-alanine N-acetyltransferase
MNSPWPVVLTSAGVRLRPFSQRDRRAWRSARQRNTEWLKHWDATAPPLSNTRPRTFSSMVRDMRRGSRAGRQLAFAVDYQDTFVGQLTVNNIVRGSAQFASIGYWIDERYAGKGIMPRAVAMAIDHCFGPARLHRIEIAIRPENAASLRIVEKLGIREIGYAPRFLHIDGDWRDHRLFAITVEEAAPGLVARLDQGQA